MGPVPLDRPSILLGGTQVNPILAEVLRSTPYWLKRGVWPERYRPWPLPPWKAMSQLGTEPRPPAPCSGLRPAQLCEAGLVSDRGLPTGLSFLAYYLSLRKASLSPKSSSSRKPSFPVNTDYSHTSSHFQAHSEFVLELQSLCVLGT